MGSAEGDSTSKASKPSNSQEQQQQPPATTAAAVYPDWSGFQAYSPIPPPGYFHSSVASSPQAHPYMWGAQHLMPPYGTPPPPYLMYPHGGIYAHPSMPPGSLPFSPYAMPSPNGTAEVSGAMPGGAEADAKSSDGKSPLKRSKDSLGSLNMLTGKSNNEMGKTSGASANGAYSQSLKMYKSILYAVAGDGWHRGRCVLTLLFKTSSTCSFSLSLSRVGKETKEDGV